MLTDDQIKNIVLAEAAGAISYIGDSDLSKNRETLMDYYRQRPYGDEQEGQSSVVTSDVSDVVETMLPSLLKLFTQGNIVGRVLPLGDDTDQEADQKTKLINFEFMQRNNGFLLLHNMFKDALLQYTGTIKAYWDESKKTTYKRYSGLSGLEYQKLVMADNVKILEEDQDDFGRYTVEVEEESKGGRLGYVGVPPEEFLINDDARDFDRPRFIGQRTPKTRSELIAMGFRRKVVDFLPADDPFNDTGEKIARYLDVQTTGAVSTHHPNDQVYLGEYYVELDANEDGITECWQVFIAGNELLEKNRVDEHPFCVVTPIPIPHRAIGDCPAAQVADLQYWKSTLVRQMNNNIYQVNYARTIANSRVNTDDLLNPVAGGLIRVEDEAPVGDCITPLIVPPQTDSILQGIEYIDTSREIRTGVTRYSQGIDAEALNKTATGFMGIREASQDRIQLIARVFRSTGVKDIFRKGLNILSKYQDEAMQIRVSGAAMEIDPTQWRYDLDVDVDIGVGQGERTERINNLNYVLQLQMQYIQMGLPVTDPTKLYNTLERLVIESGLRESTRYFNDPSRPNELAEAENMILKKQLAQLQAQMQNPLEKMEQIKGEYKARETALKESTNMAKFEAEQNLEREKFIQQEATRRTELELKYSQNVPGATV